MPRLRRVARWALWLGLVLVVLGLATAGALYWLIAPRLPDVTVLRQVELQEPLSVTSADGKLIALFGEMRRYPVAIGRVPEHVKQAFIATEDARFYEHPGVDWRGVARAVWMLAFSDLDRVPGGSTITQQVARQFFLSTEYSYTRKLTEMFLALKIERELGKDEILELYLNKSFFGNRAYGVAAAAEFYYGKRLDELTLAEAAMLASIPKFPSSGNPITNPSRAMVRRNYVLDRMFEVGFIDAAELRLAKAQPGHAHPNEPPVALDAPYAAELVRLAALERYGEAALTSGLHVVTTLDSKAQEAANLAVRRNLLDYDRRHGWRGPEARVAIPEGDGPAQWQRLLTGTVPIAGLQPALVTASGPGSATLYLGDGQVIELDLEAVRWAAPYIDENRRGGRPGKVPDVLDVGDIVRVARDTQGDWTLSQLPDVQGALVALSPETGAIRALTGGFSFALNKFNRATQSQRNPGSSFKPFVYSSAFARGFTPASIVLDAPVVFHDRWTGKSWRPQNDDGKFDGPMRLREAMVRSRNLVSVRVLDAVGVEFARSHMQGFGFPPESLPPNLSLALGTSSLPPVALARGYAVFANGGFLVDPYVVEQIRRRDGVVVHQSRPARACVLCPQRIELESSRGGGGFDLSVAGSQRLSGSGGEVGPPELHLAPRVIDERNAFLVNSLLRDVVRRGTGRGALVLERVDLGGKTGTTNDFRDAWFSGFGGDLVVTTWVGKDDFSPLGRGEFASRAALPMWVEFMRVALEGVPEREFPTPNGIVTALIDRSTGMLVSGSGADAVTEYFKAEDISRLETRMADSAVNDEEEFDIF
ncbi:MAG TPA: penicillin-binding protein 1A [Xanthomonadaceae bacterium]|nr:penicillin-binding protein 1A [Xanthomonadaceae bacterium]